MRIMVDTNILVSAALYPNSKTEIALFTAMREHTLTICTYVLDEVQDVFARKFPRKTAQLDVLLSKLTYEICYTPKVINSTPVMRDENDRPILQAAIDTDADVILTGDKDFHVLDIERPLILTPADFLAMQ